MNIKQLKKIITDNYKIMIPIILLLVVFLAFIIYYLISQTFTFSEIKTGTYYQYYGNEKITYDIEVTKDKKGVITKLEPISRYIEYDSTPIYDKNSDIVIFPQDMSVITPIINCAEYLTKAKSYIKYENKRYSLITEKYNNYLSHYFFYDGEDLYFFIEDTTLTIGEEKIELSPFSYIVANDKTITYYDKVNDKLEKKSIKDSKIYVENDYYKVYVVGDYIEYYGQDIILTNGISYLSTIDQMSSINN